MQKHKLNLYTQILPINQNLKLANLSGTKLMLMRQEGECLKKQLP